MRLLILQRGSLSTQEFVPSRSVFNRVLEPITYLATHNKDIRVDVKMPSEVLAAEDLDYSAAIFCKHNTQEALDCLHKLQANKIPVFYDLDDVIHAFTSDSLAFEHMKNVDYLRELIERSDAVVFSNNEISEVYNSEFRIRKSTVIKTGFNTDKYHRDQYDDSRNRFLYTNGDNIKLEATRASFESALNAFLEKNPTVELDLFGDTNAYLKNIRHHFLGS